MKRILFFLCLVLACSLIACGDDSSSGPKQDDSSSLETSSSSKNKKLSSSSEKEKSSSSLKESNEKDSGAEEESGNGTDNPEQNKSSSSSKEEPSSSSIRYPANYDPETKTLTDERDGEVYKTVLINNQIWMAENLRYMPEGPVRGCDELYTQEEDSESVAIYGRHYAWVDAMILPCDSILNSTWREKRTVQESEPHQGICPEGWHIPSTTEWWELIDNVGILNILSTEWVIQGQQGTDLYGFNLQHRRSDQVIGYITISGEFGECNFAGFYDDSLLARAYQLNRGNMDGAIFYLRCIMD